MSKTAVVHGGTERGILKKIKRSLLKKMSVADINEATTNAKARTIQALEAKERRELEKAKQAQVEGTKAAELTEGAAT